MARTQASTSPLHLLFLPLTTTLHFIYTLLPAPFQRRLDFTTDVSIAMSNLVFGRILPTLSYPPTDLTSKTAIVTGANSGIGLQLATDLARQGASVVLACRDLERARMAVTTINWRVPASRGRVSAIELDTSKFDSVKGFVQAWKAREDKRVDILCHNAGIAAPPSKAGGGRVEMNEDGVEIVYATNVLGSFLLTYLLEPYLASDARVVFTSSTGQYSAGPDAFSESFAKEPVRGVVEPGFHVPAKKVPILGWEVVNRSDEARYGVTKAMQCAMAKMLQRRWDRDVDVKIGDGVKDKSKVRGRVAHAFTPGFTSTAIFGKLDPNLWLKDPLFATLRATTAFATDVDQGAMTGSWLASTEDERVVGFGCGGGYWDRMKRRMCSADLYDDELLEGLWSRWESDTGIRWR